MTLGKTQTPTLPLICAPVTERGAADFLAALDDADRVADAVELRLDYLGAEDLPEVLDRLRARLGRLSKPLIFTFRPREQGGQRDLDICDRLSFWRELPPDLIRALAYADFELDLVESLAGAAPPVPWAKVICSWHDFGGTPDDLPARAERMAQLPAAVVKVATRARRLGDCLRVFEAIDRVSRAKPVIALGMELPGLPTRVLAPARGALLTFGALRPGAESAAGQPTVGELRELYRAGRLSRASEIYGVIGHPVGHSRSPAMHNAALAAAGRDAVYLPLEVDDVDEFVRDFVRPATRRLDWNLRGLSVTIPHKLAIMPHLDVVSAEAASVGAVNTVIVEGGKLRGENTDVAGAMRPLDEVIDARGARVAVLGAGGSARAVCAGLQERGAQVTVYGRDTRRTGPLAEQFGTGAAPLESFAGNAEIVINCTPIGMRGHSEGQSPLPPEALARAPLVYDLIYNPEETELLRQARAAGCRTLGGLSMLIAQAAEQFRLWTGEEPPVGVMAEAARRGLESLP